MVIYEEMGHKMFLLSGKWHKLIAKLSNKKKARNNETLFFCCSSATLNWLEWKMHIAFDYNFTVGPDLHASFKGTSEIKSLKLFKWLKNCSFG